MTKEEAITYCYEHENEYKADMYDVNENGDKAFDCLIECLESGTIQPDELEKYGMNY